MMVIRNREKIRSAKSTVRFSRCEVILRSCDCAESDFLLALPFLPRWFVGSFWQSPSWLQTCSRCCYCCCSRRTSANPTDHEMTQRGRIVPMPSPPPSAESAVPRAPQIRSQRGGGGNFAGINHEQQAALLEPEVRRGQSFRSFDAPPMIMFVSRRSRTVG